MSWTLYKYTGRITDKKAPKSGRFSLPLLGTYCHTFLIFSYFTRYPPSTGIMAPPK